MHASPDASVHGSCDGGRSDLYLAVPPYHGRCGSVSRLRAIGEPHILAVDDVAHVLNVKRELRAHQEHRCLYAHRKGNDASLLQNGAPFFRMEHRSHA